MISILNSTSKRPGYVTVWNIFLILCVTFVVLFLPLQVMVNLASEHIYFRINVFITLIFFFDIILNINILRSKENQTSRKKTDQLIRYFKSWFIFDLLAVLPFGLIFDSVSLDLIRMIKLVSVAHLMYTWHNRYFGHSTQLLLSYFIYWMILFIHWISCGWLAVLGIDPEINPFSNYFNALYWTVATMTTVGYGDIVPENISQKFYAILTMISGFAFFGYFIGNVVTILARKDPARSHYLENIEKLAITTKYRKLPFNLQQRIFDYYSYKWKKRLGFDESDFLNGLPEGLRMKVALHLKKDAITHIPLFKNATKDFIEEISLHLKPSVLTPGDRVFRAGDDAINMYFVIHGDLEVYSKDKIRQLTTISKGDFFGEIALFLNEPRTATVIAKTYCDLYTLSKSAFEQVIVKYPEIAKQIEKEINIKKERDKL